MFLIINGVIVASSTQYIYFAEECLHIVLFLYQICWHVGRYAKHVQLLLCSIFFNNLKYFSWLKEDGWIWRTKCPFNTEYRLWVRRLKSEFSYTVTPPPPIYNPGFVYSELMEILLFLAFLFSIFFCLLFFFCNSF